MGSTLIRGKYVVVKVTSRTESVVVADGAVFQRDGIVVEVGPYAELAARHHADQVLGSQEHVIVPGFVNAHHHVGLTPFQLGSPDYPLELWFASRMGARAVEPYLDTLYSAFEMLESGITTVQHLHGWRVGPASRVIEVAERILKAYDDIGMRVSYSFALRDQNRLAYEADEAFARRLPAPVSGELLAYLRAQAIPVEDHHGIFTHLWEKCGRNASERARVQLAPANLHWCSDGALESLREWSSKYRVPMHMHLVETAYQKEYARRRTGGTALGHLVKLGLTGPHLTLGHGVWLSEEDIERVADSGTSICHNASSNLRLRSGVGPLNHWAARGVRVGIGLDEAGINDDRDMLQEMRMVLRAHRVPGMEDNVPTPAQVFRMATSGGAKTTAFGERLGVLEPGRAADMVLIDWRQVSYPYLDAETPLLDAVLQRAKAQGVTSVVCDGEVIYADGRFTKVDRDGALRTLHDELSKALSDDEVERRRLSKALLPHVKAFYANYFDPSAHAPFYRPSSRI
jgi:cytosine/adenosine deaminase-related metal-dependent hydrolase